MSECKNCGRAECGTLIDHCRMFKDFGFDDPVAFAAARVVETLTRKECQDLAADWRVRAMAAEAKLSLLLPMVEEAYREALALDWNERADSADETWERSAACKAVDDLVAKGGLR